MNKLRFHLGAGHNFMKWQVTTDSGVKFYDPNTTQLRITGCELKNNRKRAETIYDGARKSVCAWVQFQKIDVVHNIDVGQQIRFNPREKPYWHLNWSPHCIDGMVLPELVTSGASICLPA